MDGGGSAGVRRGLPGTVGRLMRGDEVEVRALDDVRGVKEVLEIIRMSIRR